MITALEPVAFLERHTRIQTVKKSIDELAGPAGRDGRHRRGVPNWESNGCSAAMLEKRWAAAPGRSGHCRVKHITEKQRSPEVKSTKADLRCGRQAAALKRRTHDD